MGVFCVGWLGKFGAGWFKLGADKKYEERNFYGEGEDWIKSIWKSGKKRKNLIPKLSN